MKKRKMYSTATIVAFSAVFVGATGVSADQPVFKDVSDTHPYAEAIYTLSAAGIINGMGDGTFKPDAPVTRGQAAKMIAGTFQLETVNVENPNFTDVSTSNLYFGPIAALIATGLVGGYDDQTFRPNENITHGQIKEIVTNTIYAFPIDIDQLFTLSKVNYSENKEITRGELASILVTVYTMIHTPNDHFKLSIMHVNDTHARVEMFPKLMTAVKEQRANTPDALLLHAGDVFSGTLYFNEFEGQADLPFLNALKFDAITLGNHEFDLGSSAEGHKALADFIKAAHFPVLSANIDFTKDTLFTGLFTDLISSEPENGKIYAGMIKEINGEKVGIFGLTTAETKDISSPGSI